MDWILLKVHADLHAFVVDISSKFPWIIDMPVTKRKVAHKMQIAARKRKMQRKREIRRKLATGPYANLVKGVSAGSVAYGVTEIAQNEPSVSTKKLPKIEHAVLKDTGPLYQIEPAPRRPYSEDDEADLSSRLVDELDEQMPDVRQLAAKYGLRREELGRLTGFSLRALAEWSAGKLPSDPAQRRLREVHRLLNALSEIVEPESIPGWLHKRNRAFGGMTPLQVIEVGEMDRLWAMIHQIGSGYLD